MKTRYALAVSWAVALVLWCVAPFPGYELHLRDFSSYGALISAMRATPRAGQNALLESMYIHAGGAHTALLCSWAFVLLSLPFLLVRFPLCHAIEKSRSRRRSSQAPTAGPLPPYPLVKDRERLSFVVGEVHEERSLLPSKTPRWLEIPDAGLYIGTLVLGASGSGKTTTLMLPAAKQLFGFKAGDPVHRCGGLVLEAKGNFCTQVRDILFSLGRKDDYIEIGPDSDRVYNPLHGDTDATQLAFDIMAMVRNLAGESKDEGGFFAKAEESFLSFAIQIHRLIYGYVTLRDIYVAAVDLGALDAMMQHAEETLSPVWILIDKQVWTNLDKSQLSGLEKNEAGGPIKWEPTPPQHLRTRASKHLIDYVKRLEIPASFEEVRGGPGSDAVKRELEIARLSYKGLRGHDPKTLANVCHGIEVILDVSNKNQDFRRIFCPPKEAYDPDLNKDFRYGRPVPKLEDLIETPAVIGLRVRITGDAKIGRIMGTLLKQNWQRAVIGRIEQMTADSRALVLLADEYHLLLTVGGSRPVGDEKFLSLSREARCVPIMAIPSMSAMTESAPSNTWRTLFSSFASVICMRQNDYFTAEHVSKMAGREAQFRQAFSIGEGNTDPLVSPMSGAVVAEKKSVSLGHSWSSYMDALFEPKLIRELPRAVALAMINDGSSQLKPTFCYLKHIGADPNVGYFG